MHIAETFHREFEDAGEGMTINLIINEQGR